MSIILMVLFWVALGTLFALALGKGISIIAGPDVIKPAEKPAAIDPPDPFADLDRLIKMNSHRAVLELLPVEVRWDFSPAGQPCSTAPHNLHHWRASTTSRGYPVMRSGNRLFFCRYCDVTTVDADMAKIGNRKVHDLAQ